MSEPGTNSTNTPVSYRFLARPKWIGFHLLVIVAIVGMVNLGLWQLRRLDERRSFNSTLLSHTSMPVIGLEDLLAEGGDPSTLQYRTVTLSGHYTDAPMVEIVNRSQAGSAGRNLVNALETDDGTVVIVNRGFLALLYAAPTVPTGEVNIIGRVRTSETRRTGEPEDERGVVLEQARRIDLDILGPQFGGDVAPVYVEVLSSQPLEATLSPVPAPELSEGSHLSYAFQWFIFATCVAVGWALAVYRSAHPRSRRGPPPIDEELSAEYARRRAAERAASTE